MKFLVSFVLCGALIGIISLQSVTAARAVSEDDQEFHGCAGIYLKSIGKLEYDVVSKFTLSECTSIIQDFQRSIRDEIENNVKRSLVLPSESTCVMTATDKSEFTVFLIKTLFVKTNSTLSRSEKDTTMTTMIMEQMELVKSYMMQCGIDGERLNTLMKML